MKKIKKKFSKRASHQFRFKAFTLMELLVIFAITGIIAGVSINSFVSYNNSQIISTNVSQFASFLNTARARAISQVKPESCGSGVLGGYEVRITISGSDYVQNAICAGSPVLVDSKKLPAQLSFVAGSATSILFDVGSGTVSAPGTITIAGYGKTGTVTVDSIGKISVSQGGAPPSGPTPTPTPLPQQAGSASVTVSSSPNPSILNQRVTFTAIVTGSGCTPLGAVYFYSDNTLFNAAPVTSNANPAVATVQVSHLSSGSHQTQARYTGYDTGCPSANSANHTHNVN